MRASPERRHDSLGALLFETARQLLAVGAAVANPAAGTEPAGLAAAAPDRRRHEIPVAVRKHHN